MFCVRGPRACHRNNLGKGIDRQPQPENLCSAAQPRAEFVQLQVGDLQVAEAALMEDLSVAACASEPCRDGGLTITEDPQGFGWVQTFGECSEHHGDLLGGGFQMVQGSIVSSALSWCGKQDLGTSGSVE